METREGRGGEMGERYCASSHTHTQRPPTDIPYITSSKHLNVRYIGGYPGSCLRVRASLDMLDMLL